MLRLSVNSILKFYCLGTPLNRKILIYCYGQRSGEFLLIAPLHAKMESLKMSTLTTKTRKKGGVNSNAGN